MNANYKAMKREPEASDYEGAVGHPATRSSLDRAVDAVTGRVDLPARVLLSLLFLASGFGKLAAVAATQGYMTAFGVPPFLIWPAAALEIGGGVLLVVGWQTRPLALVLAGWCLLTAAIFHTVWSEQVQQVMFLKNMAMAGGFLLLAKTGSLGASLDGRRAARRTIPL